MNKPRRSLLAASMQKTHVDMLPERTRYHHESAKAI